MHVHTHIHACIYTHTHEHVCTYSHIHILPHAHKYICMWMYTHTHAPRPVSSFAFSEIHRPFRVLGHLNKATKAVFRGVTIILPQILFPLLMSLRSRQPKSPNHDCQMHHPAPRLVYLISQLNDNHIKRKLGSSLGNDSRFSGLISEWNLSL